MKWLQQKPYYSLPLSRNTSEICSTVNHFFWNEEIDEAPKTTAYQETLSRMWGRAGSSRIEHRSTSSPMRKFSPPFQQQVEHILYECFHLHGMRMHNSLCIRAKKPYTRCVLESFNKRRMQSDRVFGNSHLWTSAIGQLMLHALKTEMAVSFQWCTMSFAKGPGQNNCNSKKSK